MHSKNSVILTPSMMVFLFCRVLSYFMMFLIITSVCSSSSCNASLTDILYKQFDKSHWIRFPLPYWLTVSRRVPP